MGSEAIATKAESHDERKLLLRRMWWWKRSNPGACGLLVIRVAAVDA